LPFGNKFLSGVSSAGLHVEWANKGPNSCQMLIKCFLNTGQMNMACLMLLISAIHADVEVDIGRPDEGQRLELAHLVEY
jgi:hypothetical protein